MPLGSMARLRRRTVSISSSRGVMADRSRGFDSDVGSVAGDSARCEGGSATVWLDESNGCRDSAASSALRFIPARDVVRDGTLPGKASVAVLEDCCDVTDTGSDAVMSLPFVSSLPRIKEAEFWNCD